ncbi:hypothetical protein STEG23_007909 [Scotinomys teguina]
MESYNPPSGPPGSDSRKELQYTVRGQQTLMSRAVIFHGCYFPLPMYTASPTSLPVKHPSMDPPDSKNNILYVVPKTPFQHANTTVPSLLPVPFVHNTSPFMSALHCGISCALQTLSQNHILLPYAPDSDLKTRKDLATVTNGFWEECQQISDITVTFPSAPVNGAQL